MIRRLYQLQHLESRHLPVAALVTPAPNGRNEVIDAVVLWPEPAKPSCPGEVKRPHTLLLCERLDINGLEEVISRSVVEIQFLLCHFDTSSPVPANHFGNVLAASMN